jgi:hypothetical protein
MSVKSYNDYMDNDKEYRYSIMEQIDNLKEQADLDFDSLFEEFDADINSLLNEDDTIKIVTSSGEPAKDAYQIFKDKDENFECNVSIEGANPDTAQIRLVLDSKVWNIVLYGELDKDGQCSVPIKKGIPLAEGTKGDIRLEIIVDDQLFVGWEDEFVITLSKKVNVKLGNQKGVKVSFKQ